MIETKLPGHEELWRGSLSLGELVVALVKEQKTDTKEFQDLMKWWGRPQLRDIYKRQLERMKE